VYQRFKTTGGLHASASAPSGIGLTQVMQ
jgi:hypothetical protein